MPGIAVYLGQEHTDWSVQVVLCKCVMACNKNNKNVSNKNPLRAPTSQSGDSIPFHIHTCIPAYLRDVQYADDIHEGYARKLLVRLCRMSMNKEGHNTEKRMGQE